MADPSRPILPPATVARVRRLLIATLLASCGAVLVMAGLLHTAGRQPTAVGIVVGYLTGAAIAGSWALGAAWGFGAQIQVFRRLTLGLWPLRVAILLLGFAIGESLLGADRNALLLSLLLTWVAGQVAHGWVAMTLADAAQAPTPDPTPTPDSPAPPNPGLRPPGRDPDPPQPES